MDSNLIRQLQTILNRIKAGDADAFAELKSLVSGGQLDIDVGDISDSTAVAIGRDINQVINQTNMSTEALAFLDKMLRQHAIRAAIEAQQAGGHIFLSYSRQDAEEAQRIRNALENAGHTVWQDVTALKGGTEWMESIERGIDTCYALVSVVSKDANQSEWVKIEYLHAKRREKRIVPLKIDDCEIPTMMLATHVIFGQDDLESGIAELLDVLPDAPEGQSQVRQQQAAVDRRALEIRYLDKVLLEHSVWQTVYTPMAGVGQMSVEDTSQTTDIGMVVTPTTIDVDFLGQSFGANEDGQPAPTEEVRYEADIVPAVAQMRQLVILGDPGAGKTTTLWKILSDYATQAKTDETAPLPVFVRLGAMGSYADLEAAIKAQLNGLAAYYHELLQERRLAFLLDGLNELPAANREANLTDLKALIEGCQADDMVAAVTCRELDYTGTFDMAINERVVITPLDPLRIRAFVNNYIEKPPGKGDELFWQLAGRRARLAWNSFAEHVGDDPRTFWLGEHLPEGAKWDSYDYAVQHKWNWSRWLEERQHERSLITLASNPYMLFMMTQVFTQQGSLPPNRGLLFQRFIDYLLNKREGLTADEVSQLKRQLADLAYAMQAEGEGTTFTATKVKQYIPAEESLYHANSASILSGDDEIRFTHQLLQEYFAAYRLQLVMESHASTELYPPQNWWEPQGWEETCILLAGLYSDDCTPVVNWLRDAQPDVASRCIVESGAACPEHTLVSLRPHWLPRLTGDEQPAARAAVGRALGRLRVGGRPLDNRPGVGLDANGLPNIEWVDIPSVRDFRLITDEGNKGTYNISAFQMAKYLVTYAQFQAFVTAEDGFRNPTWWEGLAASEMHRAEAGMQAWPFDNHPRERVSWYDAVAFCRWLSAKTNQTVRLPTEWEWQWAGAGDTGWDYPYGPEFESAKSNTDESGLSRTTAVGSYPEGASSFGVLDMSGNVWEWCLNEYNDPENAALSGDASRVLRGGSWFSSSQGARVSFRGRFTPSDRLSYSGFRVCVSAPI